MHVGVEQEKTVFFSFWGGINEDQMTTQSHLLDFFLYLTFILPIHLGGKFCPGETMAVSSSYLRQPSPSTVSNRNSGTNYPHCAQGAGGF